MTTEISFSYQRTQAQITSVQVNAQQQNLALAYHNKNSSDILNRQQQQIVDEVGISDAAIKQFEEAQKLATQLQSYTDYLYGRDRDNKVQLKQPDDKATAYVAGRSTDLSASITTATIREETLDVKARFGDKGNLEELSISKTETNIEYKRLELSLRDTQFYGAFNA